MSHLDRIRPILLAAATSVALVLAATPGRAALVDPLGDFLSVYTGPPNGDLDVTAVDAILSAPDRVVLIGTHAAPVGTTPEAAYVWGIDRGAGIELFPTLAPPTGQDVTFDAVVVLLPNGTGTLIDLILGGPPLALDPSTISVSSGTINVSLPASLLPSQGLTFADYRYNLWPRFAPGGVNPGDNTQISDFAPDASTFVARVPEPASLVLLATGIAALAAAGRRRAC